MCRWIARQLTMNGGKVNRPLFPLEGSRCGLGGLAWHVCALESAGRLSHDYWKNGCPQLSQNLTPAVLCRWHFGHTTFGVWGALPVGTRGFPAATPLMRSI